MGGEGGGRGGRGGGGGVWLCVSVHPLATPKVVGFCVCEHHDSLANSESDLCVWNDHPLATPKVVGFVSCVSDRPLTTKVVLFLCV